MPRPLFTANRRSANSLIWRRFDPFRASRLPAWLIAAPLGYAYSVTLLQTLFGDNAWFARYPLIYTLALALIFHKSLIRLLWNPPILVCDEHGLTAFDEYGRWLGQWQWAQIAELRVNQQADDSLALEVIMHGERPSAPPAAEQRTLASYGTTYIPAADSPAEAPRELLPLPELGPDLLLVPNEIRRHRERAPLEVPRAETRQWYKHPRAIQLDNWRCFLCFAATLVSVLLLLGYSQRYGINLLGALYIFLCTGLLLRQCWLALRRCLADPARPVAHIDGEGITIRDGATRLHLPWRDLRRIENDGGVLVLSDYRDRYYRSLYQAGDDDGTLDAIVAASRAMLNGKPLPDATPRPAPRRRPFAWFVLAANLLLSAAFILLSLTQHEDAVLLTLPIAAAIAWYARQSHWQRQAAYSEPLPTSPPALRPDIPPRTWYRHPRSIARANWFAWCLLLPASLLALHLPNLWTNFSRSAAFTVSLISAFLAYSALRLLWRAFVHATSPVARSDRDGLHLALSNSRQRDFYRILFYGNLGGGRLNFTMPWAELGNLYSYRREGSVYEVLVLSDRHGDRRSIRANAVGGAALTASIVRIVRASKAHYDTCIVPDDPEFLDFMERRARGELPDDLDPESELAAELRDIFEQYRPSPEEAEYILADIARRRAASNPDSIPLTRSQPPCIQPRAWWLLAANVAVAIGLPALNALGAGIPAFWPFAVLTVLNLTAWRGDYRKQAVMQEERRPSPVITRPRHSVRSWYKPAHLIARNNARACARLFLLAMLGVPFTNALSKHYIFFSICLAIPIALTARNLWRELRFAFSANDQPVARIDPHGLHLAVRGNRLHAGALTLHIAWDELADIRAHAGYEPRGLPAVPEILAIRSYRGDKWHIRTALLNDFASVQDIAWNANDASRPRPEPPPPVAPSRFARWLLAANLAFAAVWLLINVLLQQQLIALPFAEPPLPYDTALDLLRIFPFGNYTYTNSALWLLFALGNTIAYLLPKDWHTRPLDSTAPEASPQSKSIRRL